MYYIVHEVVVKKALKQGAVLPIIIVANMYHAMQWYMYVCTITQYIYV